MRKYSSYGLFDIKVCRILSTYMFMLTIDVRMKITKKCPRRGYLSAMGKMGKNLTIDNKKNPMSSTFRNIHFK